MLILTHFLFSTNFIFLISLKISENLQLSFNYKQVQY